MKNKIIAFATAIILLPNLVLACAGGGSYATKIIQGVLNWVAGLAGLSSIVAIIILSIAWSLKKDKENKRSKWWMIFITIALALSFIFFYIGMILIGLVFLVTFFILILVAVSEKDEENKRSRWWLIFSSIVLFASLITLVFLKALESTLCGGSNF